MRTYAVCTLKGGVGKTTTTFNLSAAFADLGHRVLAIDADSQGNLTECLGARQAGQPTLSDVLRGQATVGTAAARTTVPGVWVLRSSPNLDEINRRNLVGERVLLARMAEIWDYVLIDCPASPGVVLLNAFLAADAVLSPVQARGMALPGVVRLLALIRDLRDRRANPLLDLTGVIVNQFDGRTRIGRSVLEKLRAQFGELVITPPVHDSVKVAESADAGIPIGHYAPTCRAAAEFRALARVLQQRRRESHGYYGVPVRGPAARLGRRPLPMRGARVSGHRR